MSKLLSIQYLRAIAALLVAAVHLHAPLTRLGYEGWFPDLLAAGVDIFFVISGVVMWVSTQRPTTPGQFFLRRLVRIVPMYWLATLLIAAIMLAMPWAVNNGRFDAAHLAASLGFLPWPHPTLAGHLYPVFVPGWTINAEMFFYAVFALALFLAPRTRLMAVAGLFAGLVVMGQVVQPQGSVSFYTQPLILEFVLGLAIGRAVTAGWRLDARLAWGLVGLGVAGLVAAQAFEAQLVAVDRLFGWGLPAALIVGGLIAAERAGRVGAHRTLGFLGDASYSIYLMHTIPLSAVSFVWARLPLDPVWLQLSYVPVALAAVVATGCVAYLVAERPMTRVLTGWLKARDSQARLAPAGSTP